MSRTYSLVTIKTLFGEASACAYPDCSEPLIFSDRGKKTVIAEIAHIRSEAAGGPRYDASYIGDVDGPDNLLLLCGKHHKPVDRHESTYTVGELEAWKLAQQASAGGGTQLTEADLLSFAVLDDESRRVLFDIARLTQRVIRLNASGNEALKQQRERFEKERLLLWTRSAPLNDEGEFDSSQLTDPDGFRVPEGRAQQQHTQLMAIWRPYQSRIDNGLLALEEEFAVLKMTLRGPIADAARDVFVQAQRAGHASDHPEERARNLEGSLRRLWKIARGEIEPDE